MTAIGYRRPGRAGAKDLPDNYAYRDRGCPGGCSKSLECPFPTCVFDDPDRWRRRQRELREARDSKVVRAYLDGMTNPDFLAHYFEVSVRTVFRALARNRSKIERARATARVSQLAD